ncbi:hypothetical protein JQX09_22420 [Sulfitobacter pseudonitzschiae]|uniref:Uncharacterized protein n=1 Tax=Pseudosulfitobacter pseudonitzschiae TaxID=1402135 RepID=A0A9Q2RZH1_9RHOB|nr:hypothetical protein [Pseudosulfitobacter pseudonitzschiae]MBM2294708.1 hypothetical protein [Pseudosulfitobacter pseudonitzschiae]MBM2299645.1 hypothetical protein [Pseudosulfitobacter pseudonitzschiae]MBM2304518.1 hypothetical protein [Pseudosulfitobacter pseudonitzschiae]MBM2314319.1 hypothetical protein [Pseudosulfitobacter pseudonitzschiae]MBM2319209.1 hypothetical protein [Pseudosulfitobacter pseudonitzschiae]
MFTIDKTPTFTHTVPVNVPVNGGHEKQSMKVTYRLLDDDTMGGYDTRTLSGQKDLLRQAVIEIGDLVDEEKEPLPFNDAMKEHIIGLPWARNALLKGYTDGIVPGLLGN